ncbi:pyridoxal phosphate-dependent decarboxylase family protein [Sanyastnella coralliicola]|uniref:pyridoxal phosphate-dependent decarboxylase family protein n=1 Tax=Sanyastnella coralliicola TaxID=3069118 RepID=UPI0027B8989F|nr:aminotransferase class I/II-fold pyridoxal phosphate-dependent enzyme [Longitalea sp. SCSIO 12813]
MSTPSKNYWKKLTHDQIKERVFEALDANVNFYNEEVIGVPGSHLDPKVFRGDLPFLKDAPFLSALVRNPNHIGCHTSGNSESFFRGTHSIEAELIELCAKKILNGDEAEAFDGYVSSGGTEANVQAAWIYRNEFMQRFGASQKEIAILCSSDSHYSQYKASNLLSIDIAQVQVDEQTRQVNLEELERTLDGFEAKGIKYVILYVNMMTTMFGSVDDLDTYLNALNKRSFELRVHVDGAYGGFFYPFTQSQQRLDFSRPEINSVTLDAHKMVQAPYGTGIFLIRKNYMHYTHTSEASYVEGEDSTLIGSRSGANAIAIWMILMTYGRFGWEEKVNTLEQRAARFAAQLEQKGIAFFRQPYSNIVTIDAKAVAPKVAEEFGLVPDNHHDPKWVKVVVMDHVTLDRLVVLLDRIESSSISAE